MIRIARRVLQDRRTQSTAKEEALMTHRIWVCADVDTEEAADKLIADLEEVIGKHNGDLQYSEQEDLG